MRVLIACEQSAVVRDAFLARGHDAWSCDLLPTESTIPDRHFQCDVIGAIGYTGAESWDQIIAHPPCTYLTNAGSKHLYIGCKKENGINPIRWQQMLDAVEFFNFFLKLKTKRLVVENPIMHCHARERILAPYSQIIQPNQFGHAETKATCLWVRGLPLLQPTKIIEPDYEKYPPGRGNGYNPKVHYASPGPKNDPGRRMRERSRTLTGIAEAFAAQWGTA